jgi:hypothetical protein
MKWNLLHNEIKSYKHSICRKLLVSIYNLFQGNCTGNLNFQRKIPTTARQNILEKNVSHLHRNETIKNT